MIYFNKQYRFQKHLKSILNVNIDTDLNMHDFRIINIAAPIDSNDIVRKTDVDNMNLSGTLKADGSIPLENNLNFSNYHGQNISIPTSNKDLSNKTYTDTRFNTINANLNNHISDTNNPHNVTESQILNGKEALLTDGNRSLQNDIDFNNNTGINVPNPTNDTDVANKQYVDNGDNNINNTLSNHINDNSNPHSNTLEKLRTVNSVLSGNIDMNSNKITDLTDPVNDSDIVNKRYVDNKFIQHDVYDIGLANIPTAREIGATGNNEPDIYAISGCPSNTKNEMYNTISNSWSSRTDIISAQYNCGWETYGNNVYVINGDPSLSNKNTVYNFTNDNWISKSNSPHGLRGNTVRGIDGKLYSLFGYISSCVNYNDMYDTSTDTWSSKTSAPQSDSYLRSAVIDNCIYPIGLYHRSAGSLMQFYNSSADSWFSGATTPTNVYASAVESYNNYVYSLGGHYSSNETNVNQKYNITSDSWSNSSNMPYNRARTFTTIIGYKIYLAGGGDPYCNSHSETFSYNV